MKNGTDGSGEKKLLDIRKYSNRRYYDATHSRHLTLEQIRDLVRDGHDIKVTDSSTGADITAQLLTQIVLELETTKLASFPVTMLVQMIRTNERLVGEFTRKYFGQAFSAYLAYQRQIEERFKQMHNPITGANPFAAWTQSIFNPFASAEEPNVEPGSEKAAPPAQAEPDLSAQLAELQRQMAALEKKMKNKQRRKK